MLLPKKDVEINMDCRKYEAVKRRLPILTEKFDNQAILWRDEENQQIGVSVDKFVRVFRCRTSKKCTSNVCFLSKDTEQTMFSYNTKTKNIPQKSLKPTTTFLTRWI